ncbi:MAG: hypothetical protein QXV17_13900 [Candidatus Micrarchaeaceae archaeon]
MSWARVFELWSELCGRSDESREKLNDVGKFSKNATTKEINLNEAGGGPKTPT